MLVTDKQYRDLLIRFDELTQKYAQMSRDIATLKMRMDMKVPTAPHSETCTKRDITKYVFLGQQLSKRQLVRECLKQYIKDSDDTCARSLIDVFPDCIQGSLGVIRSASEAEQYQDAIKHYYFNDEDILYLDEGPYVVCKDWTVSNIDRFINIMETLGYEIKMINRN